MADMLTAWTRAKAWLEAEAVREQGQAPAQNAEGAVTPATWTLALLHRAERTTAQDIHAVYKRLRGNPRTDRNGG